MEIYQLRTFLEVARKGSLTRAADALCLTQPAITRQLQALEAEAGIPLLERTSRGMQLTAAGTVLREYAARCLAVLDDCARALADLHAGISGLLAIGVGGTHPMQELPEWLQAFSRDFPAIEVRILTGRSQEMIAAVKERHIDLAFVRVPVHEADITTIPLYQEPIILAGHAGSFLGERMLTAEQARTLPYILFPHGSSFRGEIDRALAELDIIPHLRMETDSIEEIKRFVNLGFGIAFLPASTIVGEIADGRLVALAIDGLSPLLRETTLIHRADGYQSIGMQAFIRLVASGEAQA